MMSEEARAPGRRIMPRCYQRTPGPARRPRLTARAGTEARRQAEGDEEEHCEGSAARRATEGACAAHRAAHPGVGSAAARGRAASRTAARRSTAAAAHGAARA